VKPFVASAPECARSAFIEGAYRATLLFLCFAAAPAFAGNDRVVTGDNVHVTGDVAGDLIAAGGDVQVDAAVNGDVICFGGGVNISGTAKQDVYVAGGDVTVSGEVNHDLRIAGGQLHLRKESHVGGNVSLAGGDLTLDGTVDGNVRVTGGEVAIDGTVNGDVRAIGGEVRLGPNARIHGRLTYSSKQDLEQNEMAVVTGGIERKEWSQDGFRADHASWVWTLGLAVTALVILGLGPGFAARVTDTVHDEWGSSLLFGFLTLIGVPIIVAICAITVIGIPVALIVLFAYPILLLLGYVLGLIAAGDIGLQRVRRDQPLQVNERGARILASLAAIAVVAVVSYVPVVGGLVAFAVLLLGMGALVQQFGAKRRAATPA